MRLPQANRFKKTRSFVQKHIESGTKILDLGTGSGSLAVTMAKEISECKVLALDIDPKALSIAKEGEAQQRKKE